MPKKRNQLKGYESKNQQAVTSCKATGKVRGVARWSKDKMIRDVRGDDDSVLVANERCVKEPSGKGVDFFNAKSRKDRR